MDKQVFKKNIEQLTGETKQNKIANILNVSESKISKWFSGTLLPTLEDLLNISHKYNCSIDWLIGNELSKNNMSVYEACKLIVDLDSIIYLGFREEKEDIPYALFNQEKHCLEEIKVPSTYVSMHIKHLPSFMIDNLENSSEETLELNNDSIVSTLREHQKINEFVIKYTNLKKAYQGGYIDEHSLNHMINIFLEELPKEPLHHFFEFDNTNNKISLK